MKLPQTRSSTGQDNVFNWARIRIRPAVVESHRLHRVPLLELQVQGSPKELWEGVVERRVMDSFLVQTLGAFWMIQGCFLWELLLNQPVSCRRDWRGCWSWDQDSYDKSRHHRCSQICCWQKKYQIHAAADLWSKMRALVWAPTST